jgi:hypothetical protein
VQRRLPDGGFKVSNRTGRQSDSWLGVEV